MCPLNATLHEVLPTYEAQRNKLETNYSPLGAKTTPPPSELVRDLFGKTPEKRHFAEQVPKNVRTTSIKNEHKEAQLKMPLWLF
jgi:hypothetical protein